MSKTCTHLSRLDLECGGVHSPEGHELGNEARGGDRGDLVRADGAVCAPAVGRVGARDVAIGRGHQFCNRQLWSIFELGVSHGSNP